MTWHVEVYRNGVKLNTHVVEAEHAPAARLKVLDIIPQSEHFGLGLRAVLIDETEHIITKYLGLHPV